MKVRRAVSLEQQLWMDIFLIRKKIGDKTTDAVEHADNGVKALEKRWPRKDNKTRYTAVALKDMTVDETIKKGIVLMKSGTTGGS